MRRRVVVTGIGPVTPCGIGKDEFWRNIIGGRSGIARIASFDPGDFPVQIAGEVKNFDPSLFIENRKSLKVMVRDIQLAVAASRLAFEDAGLSRESLDPTRKGISIGAGFIVPDLSDLREAVLASRQDGEFQMTRFGEVGLPQIFPLWLLKYLPNMLSAHVSIIFDAQGATNSVTSGCVAGAQAIGEARCMIERGEAEVMLAGGGDCKVKPLSLIRYNLLGVLSKKNDLPECASRPFERGRDGLVLAEGAGIVVLEEFEHARRRGAQIYCELTGYGSSCGSYRHIEPNVGFHGGDLSMQSALRDAALRPNRIDYLNAHGISTRKSDLMETEVTKQVFSPNAHKVPVSSTKSMTGHMGAASGAVGFIVCCLAIQHGEIPPTINYASPDPACDLDYVPNEARRKEVRYAMTNTFGLGGQNATLIVKAV